MASVVVNGQLYTLTSRRTGEYSGPCPFGRGGEDRCSIWPDKGNYYCRKECLNCPGKNSQRVSTGGTTGWLEDVETTGELIEPNRTPVPSVAEALEYHKCLNQATLDYLAQRGIRTRIAERFKIGTNERRFTIPCLTNNGELKCHGIKKRWIGDKPEEYIPKYVLVPGSKAVAIYNYDRLIQRKHWPFMFVVESLMDVMLLEQLNVPAIAPFGGGGVWSPSWKLARVGTVIHIADNDEAGIKYAYTRRQVLGRGYISYAPGAVRFGYSDIGEAYTELGKDSLLSWVMDVRQEAEGAS